MLIGRLSHHQFGAFDAEVKGGVVHFIGEWRPGIVGVNFSEAIIGGRRPGRGKKELVATYRDSDYEHQGCA